MSKNLLNKYQAAALLDISPKLIEYFTKKTVKSKDNRKLIAKITKPELLFEKNDLEGYDNWLRAPWPAPPKKRPHLPDAIREEIKQESNFECAICCKSGEAGEAAHIEPVRQGKCNHPHNLIWLCSNHHTKFDNGCWGPKENSVEVVRSIKNTLLHFNRFAWQSQADISQQIATILHICKELLEQLKTGVKEDEASAINRIAEKLLDLLPNLTEKQKSKSTKQTLEQLSEDIEQERIKPKPNTRRKLEIATSYEEEYLDKSGLKRCPLCLGENHIYHYDCPVCGGDGSIRSNVYPDLSPFERIKCKLCKGSGLNNHMTCPVCVGDGEIERRFDEVIDYSQYDDVECPLCEGTTKHNYDDCPVCNAEGYLPQRVAFNVDTREYDEVECPLCEARGIYNHDTCPACRGDRYMQRRFARDVDISEYQDKKCPACKGKRTLYGEECPLCRGDGSIPAHIADQTDISLYKLVKCPACKGKRQFHGDDCTSCNGEGTMLKLYVEKYY